ncbi:DUF5686 and carboxypeptidase-like regulatory domain-containing protein [Luteibaculum oceani]|uniref:DUF5686 and carboxypeptidase-like regulatory domain-containing protein n=1 Tax=Luteibaculum oceani TaxID=1294296 RepID=UPI001477827F|nr:DUF5686 and carboxypeptidase-like regulatory domain-containing protein [Luteibaculum oceani]
MAGFIAKSQQTEVRGRVVDAETGEALPYVNISFQGTKIGTTSDLDGNFVLKSYYASDTVVATFVGYMPSKMGVILDQTQTVEIKLQAGISLAEVEVRPDKDAENPAHPIIRKVIANKKINDREKLRSYSYEVYNKVEFDLNNVTEDFKSKKAFRPFEFIFDYIDTTGEKDYLPIFISETISEIYYRKFPKAQKESINAVKVSGIENESVSQFLGDMYQNVNVYDNNISVFGKPFISPISNSGFAFYKYYLLDSLWKDNYWCYHIKFIPKRENDPVYNGEMFIHDTTYAIKEFRGNISEEANINFVKGFEVTQIFEQVKPEVWMLTKDKLVVDFALGEKTMGLYGRKTSTYKNHKVNEELPDEFYNTVNQVEVEKGAREKGEDYWQLHRHEELDKNEKAIYFMVDSLKEVPTFQTYLDIVNIVFTGYKVVGNFEFGPYYSLYSFNPVEGNRFKLGVRTSNDFSTRVAFSTYGAYGLRDQKLKYGASFFAFVSKEPRSFFELSYHQDIEQLGLSQNAFSTDNFFGSFLRRNPANKLNLVTEYKGYYEHEWFYGFSNRLIFSHRNILPRGALEFRAPLEGTSGSTLVDAISTTEVGFYTRFAYKERFVSGEFDRISLGTDKPIIEIQLTKSLPGVLNADYNYTKLYAALSDEISFGYFGYTELRSEAGKIWGRAPYPLLEIHKGNETFFYDDYAFNTMNFFEFVSDQFVSVSGTHHFGGLFLNRIPLLKKLKLREVVSAKAVYGTYNSKNSETLQLSEGINTFSNRKPFLEAAVGVENILKFLRIDALWRLSYLQNPNIVDFGIRAKLQLKF